MSVHIAGQSLAAENLLAARDFLRVVYPGLTAIDPVIQFVKASSLTAPLRFGAFLAYVNEGDEIAPSQYANALLTSEFRFDEAGRLEQYLAKGRLVLDSENAKLAHDLEQQPEWSDERIAAELKKRGARFGPDSGAQFMTVVLTVLPRNVEPMLGRLTLVSADFAIPLDNERRWGLSAGALHWEVRYQTSTGRSVLFIFEPFGGALTSVLTTRPL